MAVEVEPQSSRLSSQSRHSIPAMPSSNMAVRHANPRHHSHSLSLGTLNSGHRVSRRKSVSASGTNRAAVAAAINDVEEGERSLGRPECLKRQSFAPRESHCAHGSESISLNVASIDNNPSFVPKIQLQAKASARNTDPIKSDGALAVSSTGSANNNQGRGRRASEGAHTNKTEKKRVSGSEVKCDQCGKGYKHSSCLTKHLWEHTPQWGLTSKLLISKHQQVQLLEAASVLVNMNQDGPTPFDQSKGSDSEQSSASPTGSGASEANDEEISSAETTPPPMSEHAFHSGPSDIGRSHRYSSNGSSFSRSYQSAPSGSLTARSVPMGNSFGQHARSGYTRRPSTSGVLKGRDSDEDEAGLVAAVESLCSFGTPRSCTLHLDPSVPPVPPLPARFSGLEAFRFSADIAAPTMPSNPLAYPLMHRTSDERDVMMKESNFAQATGDHRGHHQDNVYDDDGVFGRME